MSDIVLVSMPFGNVFAPSMGLSLLKGGLEREGVSNRVLYFGIGFAELIGQVVYCDIADSVRPSVRELAGSGSSRARCSTSHRTPRSATSTRFSAGAPVGSRHTAGAGRRQRASRGYDARAVWWVRFSTRASTPCSRSSPSSSGLRASFSSMLRRWRWPAGSRRWRPRSPSFWAVRTAKASWARKPSGGSLPWMPSSRGKRMSCFPSSSAVSWPDSPWTASTAFGPRRRSPPISKPVATITPRPSRIWTPCLTRTMATSSNNSRRAGIAGNGSLASSSNHRGGVGGAKSSTARFAD